MKKGFSLVELMIVIVIMGILAAIAVPNIFGQIERSRRTLDAVNALEIGKILHRAHMTDVIQFPANTNYNINVNGQSVNAGMSVAVFVTRSGINYYRGSGAVLVNGGDWNSDGGVAYKRIQSLFEQDGFTDVVVNTKNVKDGGWSCYGAALFAGGKVRFFSEQDESKCKSATSNGSYETVLHNALNSGSNSILNYIPGPKEL